MTAPDPADVAGAVQAIRAARFTAYNDASDEQIAAAVIAWAAPRIRQQAAAQERERIRLALLAHFRSPRPHLCPSMLEGGKCGAGTWADLIGGDDA